MIGLETLGMSLEDIFISVVDKNNESRFFRLDKSRRQAKSSLETEMAQSMLDKAAESASADSSDKDE